MKHTKYSSIAIIYNPNSTGDSAKNAKELKKVLSSTFKELGVKLYRTEYAGHAEKLAYELASASKQPLIISASGDGGYNEVVNGALKAQAEGATPICAVLASGNANDHSRALQDGLLSESVKSYKIRHIDVLKIEIKKGNRTRVRYAHSYVGLGLTPVVATELNKTDLNALRELRIVLKTFYKYRPFKIKHNHKILRLDSIIFANIGEMAKVLTISKESRANDGLFEIISFPSGHKVKLVSKLAKATVTGLKDSPQKKSYSFTVLKNMPAQLDGEVVKISRGSVVTVTSEHKLLTTIL